MATISFKKDNKGNVESVAIHGVTFYYTNIRTPRPIFDDRKLPFAQARKEYSVEVAVTEEIADEWDEVFAKQPSKKYTNAKFMEHYKLEDKAELPFPDEKKQYTIKITQKAEKKDGDPISDSMIPRVFVVEDGKGKDITFEVNVGNGSKGSVLARANSNDYGSFAYLSKIKVDDLIEYESGGGISEEDKDFLGVDDVELADAPERQATKATKATGGDSDSDDGDGGTKDSQVADDIDDDDF